MTTTHTPAHAAFVRMKVPALCIAALLLTVGAALGLNAAFIGLLNALPQSWLLTAGRYVQEFIGTKGHTKPQAIALFAVIMLFSIAAVETETRRRVGSAIRKRLHSAEATLAALIAGKRHAHLQSEWTAHLAGPSDSGKELSTRERDAYALGFLVAAVRIRLSDIIQPLWRPVDWVLRSDGRVNAVVASCCATVAGYLIGCDGLRAFLSTDCVGVGVIGSGVFTLLRSLRTKRGIELTQLTEPGETPGDTSPR